MKHFKVLSMISAQKSNFKFSSLIIFTLLLIVIGAASCKKSNNGNLPAGNTDNQQKLDVTNDIIEASASDEENFDMVMGNGEFADNANAALNAVSHTLSNAKVPGRTITFSPSKDVYPHTKTIDYGIGWTDASGVTMSGKIIITFYDAAEDAEGKYSLTTYDNYHVNDIHVEGSIQINKIKNGTGEEVYLHIIHKTISDAGGNIKDYNGNTEWRLISWHDGTNNAYEITGHTVGKETYNGIEANNFKTDIDENNPVIKPFTCKRVQGGATTEINLAKVAKDQPNKLEEYLDFGNGECDNIATLSINGAEAVVVILPLRFWPLNL
jgi:hypothetical protein